MITKVKDLTVEELRILISDTVTDSMQDLIEDMTALSSENYLHSIEEARIDAVHAIRQYHPEGSPALTASYRRWRRCRRLNATRR